MLLDAGAPGVIRSRTMTNSPLGRRRFLGTAAGAAVATAAGIPPAPRLHRPGGPAATFRWLGTAGWRIDIGAKTVLIDPYLSRFRTGLFDGAFRPDTALTVDAARVAEHAGTPQTVF